MAEVSSDQFVAQIMASFEDLGETQRWASQHVCDSAEEGVLCDAFRQVTVKLLGAQPPQTAYWEQLMVAAADASTGRQCQAGLAACKAAIAQLNDMVQQGELANLTPQRVVALGGAITLTLAAQVKLNQAAEQTVHALQQQYPQVLQEMGQLCQEIWLRRGQMSGIDGLFVWDVRERQWRLRQDFKAYRPTE